MWPRNLQLHLAIVTLRHLGICYQVCNKKAHTNSGNEGGGVTSVCDRQSLIRTTFLHNGTMDKPQKVLDGNRITLPFEFLEKHGLKEGSFVLVEDTKAGLLIKPARVVVQ